MKKMNINEEMQTYTIKELETRPILRNLVYEIGFSAL